MKMLLDTCVVSEWRKTHSNSGLKEFMETADENDLYVSVISLGEVVKGIVLLEDGRRKNELQSWLNDFENHFAERILSFDQETSHIWGEITAKTKKTGNTVPICDGLITATALRHGLHVITRNISNFIPTGVLVINPWSK